MRITLDTDLPPDECARRLRASGWAGTDQPGQWRPTATDRDLFRRLEGHRFWLATRDVHLGPGAARALGLRFHGTLLPHGRGTRIVDDDGRRPGRPLLLLAVLIGGALLIQLARAWTGSTGPAAPGGTAPVALSLRTSLTTIALCATLAGLLLTLARVTSRRAPAPPSARFTAFLITTLEARPADATDTRNPTKAVPGSTESAGAGRSLTP